MITGRIIQVHGTFVDVHTISPSEAGASAMTAGPPVQFAAT